MAVGAFNALERPNCQAKVLHAGTTQDTSSVVGTLLAGIISYVNCSGVSRNLYGAGGVLDSAREKIYDHAHFIDRAHQF